jgi:hypothetical protein
MTEAPKEQSTAPEGTLRLADFIRQNVEGIIAGVDYVRANANDPDSEAARRIDAPG